MQQKIQALHLELQKIKARVDQLDVNMQTDLAMKNKLIAQHNVLEGKSLQLKELLQEEASKDNKNLNELKDDLKVTPRNDAPQDQCETSNA